MFPRYYKYEYKLDRIDSLGQFQRLSQQRHSLCLEACTEYDHHPSEVEVRNMF